MKYWKQYIALLLVAAIPAAFVLAQADSTDTGPAPAPAAAQQLTRANQPLPECPQDMEKFIRDETLDLGDFMTTHFQSGDPTSGLLPQALDRFRLYYLDLYNALGNLKTSAKTAADNQAIVQSCKQRVTDAIFAAKEILKMHAAANSNGKKATQLLDRYKEINRKLEELNVNIAQFYGYFLTFSNKLPCYVKDSCN